MLNEHLKIDIMDCTYVILKFNIDQNLKGA